MYEIEPDPLPAPRLPGAVSVAADADEMIDRVAEDLVQHAFNCVRQFGDFHLAVTAPPLLEPLYRRLMYDPQYRWLPWRRTHLWLAWECGGEAESVLQTWIGEHADLPAEQLHLIPERESDPARAYEARVREVLGWREKGQDRFDYVLLALDSEGTVAGLFPGSPVLDSDERLYLPHGTSAGPAVSMTPAFVRASRFVAIAGSGAETNDAVKRLASPDRAPLPAGTLSPIEGELKWYLDVAAAAETTTDA